MKQDLNGRKKTGLVMATLFLAATTIGCSSTLKNAQTNPGIACESPRPQVCTMDYTPVCGERSDTSQKTYSNACTACSHKDVVSYRPGTCP